MVGSLRKPAALRQAPDCYSLTALGIRELFDHKIYLRSRASEMKVIADFYINVRLAAHSNAEVKRILAALR